MLLSVNGSLEMDCRRELAVYGERSRAVLSMIARISATRPAGVSARNMASKPSPDHDPHLAPGRELGLSLTFRDQRHGGDPLRVAAGVIVQRVLQR